MTVSFRVGGARGASFEADGLNVINNYREIVISIDPEQEDGLVLARLFAAAPDMLNILKAFRYDKNDECICCGSTRENIKFERCCICRIIAQVDGVIPF